MGWIIVGCVLVSAVIGRMLRKQHGEQQNRIVNKSKFKRRFDK